ncbi:hypothetical protein [Komagataeibacter xylinus]|uniref:hypothetical protein n=1 Tax=Komagataeibacter xylinus TaxID=28448 RepID=UPI00280AF8B1|nr:hypothetical protein [Komagataeibacter xylinus]
MTSDIVMMEFGSSVAITAAAACASPAFAQDMPLVPLQHTIEAPKPYPNVVLHGLWRYPCITMRKHHHF